eukprot:TRINITY_DN11666_c0_g1_i1.p1 TRINITY_DN11666_c0_g1~~TRINITY_DN11666_c0_g1_i1.p1  ORF type:complete len:444 (+),score=110.20 TRINITY_DN11666_c0_g1_i1:39-1334(+)
MPAEIGDLWQKVLSAKHDVEFDGIGALVVHAATVLKDAGPTTILVNPAVNRAGGDKTRRSFAVGRISAGTFSCGLQLRLEGTAATLSCSAGEVLLTGLLERPSGSVTSSRGIARSIANGEVSSALDGSTNIPKATEASKKKAPEAAPASPAKRARFGEAALKPASPAAAAAVAPPAVPTPVTQSSSTASPRVTPAAATAAADARTPPKAVTKAPPGVVTKAPVAGDAKKPTLAIAKMPPAAKSPSATDAKAPPAADAKTPPSAAAKTAPVPATSSSSPAVIAPAKPVAAASGADAVGAVAGTPEKAILSKRQQKKASKPALPLLTRKLPCGVEFEVLTCGKGRPALPGALVEIKYESRVAGQDECFDFGTKSFRLGMNEELRALDEGIKDMLPGEKRRLHSPARCGYGVTGNMPKVPPNSDLVFEIELLKS